MNFDYATNYAIIEDGVVVNLIWGMLYTAHNTYPNCLRIDDLLVDIGDTYDGEFFYHNGERVKTMAEQLHDMQAALDLLGVEA